MVVGLSAVLLALTSTLASRPAAVDHVLTRVTVALTLFQAGLVGSGLLAGAVLPLSSTSLAATGIAVAGILGLVSRRLPSPAVGAPRCRSSGPVRLAIGGAAGLALAQHGWRAYQALRFPVLDWDGLSYHLVTVDVWLQEQGIGAIPQRIWSDGYPANAELLTLWLVSLSGTDTYADLTSVATVPLFVAGTSLLARELGADGWSSALAGLIASLVPAVVVLSSTTYVDVPASATAVAGLGLSLAALRLSAQDDGGARSRSLVGVVWVAAGCALGLAAGAKTTALILVGVAAIAILGTLAYRARSRRPHSMVPVVAGLCIAVVLGGFWYVANFIDHANPFYPVAIGPFEGPVTTAQIASVQLPAGFEQLGTFDRIARSWVTDLRGGVVAYDVRPGGFGWLWPTVLLPSALIVTIGLVIRRRWTPLLVVGLPVAVSTALTPMPWWARLTLPLIAYGAAAFGVLLASVRRRTNASARDFRAISGWVAASLLVIALASNAWAISRTTNHPGRVGPNPTRPLTAGEVFELSRKSMPQLLSTVSPWATCTRLDDLPEGSRVATSGVTHPHLLVGHELSRVLTAPLPDDVATARALEAAVDERRADHLVLEERRPIDSLARSSRRLELVTRGVCGEFFPALSVYRVARTN